jgi:hypothetical protein
MPELETWYKFTKPHTRYEDGDYVDYEEGDKVKSLRESEKRSIPDKVEETTPPPEKVDLDRNKDELLQLADVIGIPNNETASLNKEPLKELIKQYLNQ